MPWRPRYATFDEILPFVDTGDVFLFSGDRPMRICGGCHWSHIGIVFKDSEGLTGEKGLVYIFEANFNWHGWDHCDLRLAKEKVETYKKGMTDVAWRSIDADVETRRAMGHAILRYRGCPYQHDLTKMFLAGADCCPCCERVGQQEQDDENVVHKMYCSQNVAKVYMDVGLLDKNAAPSNEYVPRDFDEVWNWNVEARAVRLMPWGGFAVIKRKTNTWKFF